MSILRAFLAAFISAIVAAGAAYFLVIRPKVRSWGVQPGEAEMPVPGDDLVPDASATETRGVTIDAPPTAVWPWLVQMGYDRGGWYSYDAMDMKGASATEIKPEFQHIAPGEVMPTHPGGGFLVKVVEPERALVLYSDTQLVRAQQAAAKSAGTDELPTAGLKASGAMLDASFPEFAASWALLLERVEGDKTRLIERMRARTPGNGPVSALLGEIMGTGIVLMQRKQLLGIKSRVEGTLGSEQPLADRASSLDVLELEPAAIDS
jgi:proline iminopeptidase